MEGDQFQQVRGWFGVTFPCSGVLIGGLPLARLRATYEEDEANPTDNIPNGIQNPEQSLSDTSFTLTRRISIGQSRFYGPAGPDNSTFGETTDYLPVQVSPSVQIGGAQVVVEFMAADLIDESTQTVKQAGDFTKDANGDPAWVRDINLCDGMRHIRYRVSLVSNLINLQTARVTKVLIPMVQLP